jgi:hypothetical protein
MPPRKREEPTIPPPELEAPAAPAGIAYRVLDVERKRAILEARLAQVESEHMQHELNRSIAEQHLDGPLRAQSEQQIRQANTALVVLEAAHATILAELEALEG